MKKNLKRVNICTLDNLFRNGSEINKSRLSSLGIKNFNIDIKNYNKIIKLKKFDLIIDACAEPAIEISSKNPTRVFETNLVGTFNILKKCVKDKAGIIFLSSSRVYSINTLRKIIKNKDLKKPIFLKKKINEEFDTSSPCSLYGFTKLSSEKMIQEFSFMNNIKYIINRFGVIAGPWQFGKQDQGFMSMWVIKHILKSKLKFIGFGGFGNQVRDVIHIDDVNEILLKQIKNFRKKNNDIFNIGGGIKNAISLKQLTNKCFNLTGSRLNITKKKKTSDFDIPYFVTDNTKIKKEYNWEPKKDIDTIINDIYFWFLNNKTSLKRYFK